MSITTREIARVVLQSEYEELLPDGMGLSLPVPVMYKDSKSMALFAYSIFRGIASPPKGVFYIHFPELKVITYKEVAFDALQEKTMPRLDDVKKATAIKTIENSLETVFQVFPSADISGKGKQTVKLYVDALYELSGEAIQYYQNCFPDFFEFSAQME